MQANTAVMRAIQEVMKKQGYIEIPSHGISMLPFIRTGNVCRFEPVEPSQLRKGDVVLFLADTGILVGHRYFGLTSIDNRWMIVCKGDSNLYPDEPVPADRIIGRMILIRKPFGHFRASGLWMKLWGWLVTRLPFISLAIHTYLRVTRKLRGMKNRLWAS